MQLSPIRTTGTLLAALLLAACVSPVPELPDTDVPPQWLGPVAPDAAVWPASDWWNAFGTAELSSLIASVQQNNLDLANNQRNLEAAQITLREAGFNLLPTPVVTLGTGASYTESSTELGATSGSPNTPFSAVAGFTYNDILSRPATFARASADYQARVAQAADFALNTLGTASSTYFQLLLTRDKVVAAQQNLANAEAIGAIAQARVDAGVAVPIEALQQRIAIERERNNLRSLIQNDLAARSSLALLQGQSVQGFDMNGQSLQTIVVPTVQPGLPSELLQRRPDLVQAEANLKSANASIAIVRSDLFPQISLTGSVNASSVSLSQLVASPDTVLNISSNLVQTLLDNGQRYRNIDQARLTMENNLATYRRLVLQAFNEIEVLLSNIQLLQALGQVAFDNLGAAEESYRIAEVRYREGVTDYQTVLIAQNTLFSSRNAWLDNKLLQLNAIVGLYQALGGGWQAEQPATP
jgi:NodT family efflux transporter outer membrane factor (OMF) lipoprotein